MLSNILLTTALLAAGFAKADYITIDSYAGKNCDQGHGLIEINGDSCATPGGNGYNVESYYVTALEGNLFTLTGYADGSACVGSTVFVNTHDQSQVNNGQCFTFDGGAGSLGGFVDPA